MKKIVWQRELAVKKRGAHVFGSAWQCHVCKWPTTIPLGILEAWEGWIVRSSVRMGACLGVLRLPKPLILEPSYGGGVVTFFCPIFGTAFAPKTFCCKEKPTFWGPFWGPKWWAHRDVFFVFFVIFGFIFGDPVSSENLIFCQEKPGFWGSFWTPKRDHF